MKEKFPLLVAFLSLSILFGNASAQASEQETFICPDIKFLDNPPEFKPVDDPNIAYKKLKNRCEGFYQASISGGNLDLVSLLYGELTFNAGQTKPLRITLPNVSKQPVHVQAVGIPLKVYYRLDALLKPGKTLEWPLDIVNKEEMKSDQIGLFGQPVNDQDSYIPLSVSDDGAAPLDTINLILRSSVDVSIVHWRQNTMSGKECDLSQSDWQSITPTSAGRFSAGKPIKLRLSPPKKDFCIEFAAQNAEFDEWMRLFLKIRMS